MSKTGSEDLIVIEDDDDIQIIESDEGEEEDKEEDKEEDPEEDKEEEEELNSAECLLKCEKFAYNTGTDKALAMFYLQDRNWNLEEALEFYYQQITSQNTEKVMSNKKMKVVACFDIDKLNELNEKEENKSKNSEPTTSNSNEGKYFKILSWNIDGLDENCLQARCLAVCNKIKEEKPDVVLLQEVTEMTQLILLSCLDSFYEFSTGYHGSEYFVMILNLKATITKINEKLVRFHSSLMGRCCLQVKLRYKNKLDFYAMTTHLESTADFASERMKQLKQCFEEMKSKKNELVFFGGDLNLRDSEVIIYIFHNIFELLF
jgi:tyrosyl-DNA phosphodiesterase 2